MKKVILTSLLLMQSPLLVAQELEEITVVDVRERLKDLGQLKDSIIKTEVVTSQKLENAQAVNLSDAIKNERGIESREGCSICGMRRVRINGLKGEHTTVLMDGIPLNSTVSSFYGFDAMGTSGIDRVEISRGAGAALIAPEAIGGVINIVRKKATSNSSTLDMALGSNGYNQLSTTLTRVSKDRKQGTTFSGQYTKQDQWDTDDNGVNESPNNESYLLGLKYFINITPKDQLVMDLTVLKSDILGGYIGQSVFRSTVDTGGSPTFEDGDVRKRYTGTPEQVTEIIGTKRKELSLHYTHQINDFSNFVWKESYALQTQDSFYEGNDYYNTDQTIFSDFQYNNQLSARHFITVGIDHKLETLKSKSYVLFDSLNKDKDDYKYSSTGLYLRDIWTPSEKIELSTALRVNKLTTDWTDKTAIGDELDETLLAPRIHLKWKHSDLLTSRLGAGIGYRAPLTFFESEHGILDNGFDIDIHEVEKSNSVTYALSMDTDRFTMTAGASWTAVKNLAYIDETPVVPTLKNDTRTLEVKNYDLSMGYQFTQEINIGMSFELFDYDNAYKELLHLAAIEKRAKIDMEYESDHFQFNILTTWIGSRNLADYGYGDRYNIYSGSASSPKSTHAPSYVTVDMKLSKKLNREFSIYAGVKNLFDEVQEESPLYFDSAGEFDVGHIYGALRGREVYVGFKANY